jgi:hypothetical protein
MTQSLSETQEKVAAFFQRLALHVEEQEGRLLDTELSWAESKAVTNELRSIAQVYFARASKNKIIGS